jgi:hypothetical protein
MIDGLAHAWSGGDPQLPFNDGAGPDASVLILEFLLSQRLARAVAEPTPAAPGDPGGPAP